MNTDSSCNVVKDLLPIYLDGIASKESNSYVEKHLKECKSCLNEYTRLCESAKASKQSYARELNLIKDYRKKVNLLTVVGIVASVLLAMLNIYCLYAKEMYRKPTSLELISFFIIYITMYFSFLFTLVTVFIWKKTFSKTIGIIWGNVLILILLACIFAYIFLQLKELFVIIEFYT